MDEAAAAEVVTTSTTETRIGSATTTRIQGVLANELAPLHVTVQSTDKNVVNLNSRVGNMEHLIGALCSTVETLNDIAISSTSGMESSIISDVRALPLPLKVTKSAICIHYKTSFFVKFEFIAFPLLV